MTLVERSSAGIRVTAPGRLALRHVRRVLTETNALTDTLWRSSGGETGEIHVGFYLPPVNGVLASLLWEWRTAYPGVSVTPHEPTASALHTALIDCQIDAALVPDFLLDRYEAGSPVCFEPLVAVLPTSHRLAAQPVLRWSDLEGEILLLWAWGKDGIGRDFFASRLPGARLQVFEASNLTVFALVGAGYGITIAAQAYTCLNLPGLTFIPIDEDNAHFEINLVWRPEAEDPVVGKFVAFIRDRAKL